MSTVPLTHAPEGVANSELWIRGEPGQVAPGDLWMLSWDGQGLGLAVISARLDGYVLVWPVALPDDDAHAPAVHVIASPLGVALDVWPTRETGVSDALLHRRLGHLLSPRLMAATADTLDNGEDPPLPFSPPAPDAASQRRRDEAMIDHWETICLTQWPTPSSSAPRLNPDTAREMRLAPSQVAALLDVSPADSVSVVRGEAELTPTQAELLAHHLAVSVRELTTASRNAAVTALLDPTWKSSVLEVAQRLALDEARARDAVVDEFALAARSSNAVEDRLRAAFARLLIK